MIPEGFQWVTWEIGTNELQKSVSLLETFEELQAGVTHQAGRSPGGLAENYPTVARLLRLALAGTEGAGQLAAEVEKRLRALQRARGLSNRIRRACSRANWTGCETILGALAGSDPHAAVAQMRLLLGLHERQLYFNL